MSSYTLPYKITSKILKLSTQIIEDITKLELSKKIKNKPLLRKKNRIKILQNVPINVPLKRLNKIQRVGSLKSGFWEINSER